MNVLLCGDFDEHEALEWRQALTAAVPEVNWWSPEQARQAPHAVAAAVVANPPPGQLTGLPALRLVQSLWAGVDRLLTDVTLPADVPLARMVDPAMTAAMVETAVWATLTVQREFHRYAQQQRASRWQVHPQRRADECPVLVLGQGEMGQAVAHALAALGFPVSGWSTGSGTADSTHHRPAREPGATSAVQRLSGDAALHQALPLTRVLINLLPLTPRTTGLLNAALFNALPAGAAVVNLARGRHVVDEDLLRALSNGQIGHAVLDVFAHEPLPADHPYWLHERVTLLPHVAAQTDLRSAAAVVARNLRALRDGQPLQHLVRRERGY
jgi:glyoxylate/hydroxypyruvate reductase